MPGTRGAAALGLVQFGAMLLFPLAQVVLAFRTEVPWVLILTAGITLFWSLEIFLGVLLVAAPILLFVDAARNLRAMRYGA